MPLQIRRGTDAERTAMTQPLAAGELIFVTNTNRLYIGNGTTNGGVPVTDYTDEQARDAVAPMLVNGTHSAISFVYDDALDKINATVNLSDYQGVIKAAAFNGSVVANDSSLLIDGNTGKFNLSGRVGTDIIPDTDVAYDLGSATYRFRDLYLSGSSIKLGAATITAVGTAVNLPLGSTMGGVPLAGGAGSDYNGNIIGDDSTIIVNAATKVVTAAGGFIGNVTGTVTGNAGSVTNGVYITDTGTVTNTMLAGSIADTKLSTISTAGKVSNSATTATNANTASAIVSRDGSGNFLANIITSNLIGNVTGNVTGNSNGFHTGDVKGSVFADDSAMIIDGTSSRVIATRFVSDTAEFAGQGNVLILGTTATPATLRIIGDELEGIGIYSRTDGFVDGGSPINFYGQSGTYSVPSKIVSEGTLGAFSFSGYNGTTYKLGALMLASVVAGTDTTGDAFIKTNIIIGTSNGTDQPDQALLIRHDKVAEASCFKATPFADATARTAAIAAPEAGMITYITSTNKLQAYNGAGWQDLF
jgi:hypothetical protein